MIRAEDFSEFDLTVYDLIVLDESPAELMAVLSKLTQQLETWKEDNKQRLQDAVSEATENAYEAGVKEGKRLGYAEAMADMIHSVNSLANPHER